MNETTRTGVFVGGAILSLLLATAFAPSTPQAPNETSEVGKKFYNDFNATDAESLQVVSFNEATATAKTFEVDFKDGVWRIPSHHNYPADAKDRLAKTAASMLGIKRDQFRSASKEDFAELGVVDPLDQDTTKLKGRGQRVTIKGKGGTLLADYIIGKSVKGRAGFYYIRRPQDNSVYVAKLNIDLSTKFADWIETNLLQLGSEKLKQVIVNKYSISDQGRAEGREVTELTRDKAGDPWKLKGLDEAKEEMNTADVDTMVRTLEDLRIVGVRPKPQGLSQDLKQSKSIKINTATMLDLQSRGFFFTQSGDLVSQEGELLASTNDGVAYVLRFGEVFTSTDDQTESGIGAGPESDADKKKDDKKSPEKKDEKAADKKEDPAKKDEKKEGDAKDGEKKASNVSENRYVFINVTFDPKKLGPKPVKPEAPAAPAADKKPDEKKPDEKKADDKKPEEKKSEEKKDEAKKDEAKPDPKAEDLKKKYEEDLKKYETDLADYDKRMKEGKEKVAELNRRFADWYYVISADSFNKIRLSRKALVKEKTAPGTTPPAGIPGAKGLPGLNLPAPGSTPPTKEEKPMTEEKPTEKKPEGDKKPEAENKADEKPPVESKPTDKPAEKPVTEKPAAEKKEPTPPPVSKPEEAKKETPAAPPAGEKPPEKK